MKTMGDRGVSAKWLKENLGQYGHRFCWKSYQVDNLFKDKKRLTLWQIYKRMKNRKSFQAMDDFDYFIHAITRNRLGKGLSPLLHYQINKTVRSLFPSEIKYDRRNWLYLKLFLSLPINKYKLPRML